MTSLWQSPVIVVAFLAWLSAPAPVLAKPPSAKRSEDS